MQVSHILKGFVLVYDITNKYSLQQLETIIEYIRKRRDGHVVPIVLVGNKSDKIREVSRDEGKEFCQKHKLLYFEENSTVNATFGTARFFDKIARKIYEMKHPYLSTLKSCNIV